MQLPILLVSGILVLAVSALAVPLPDDPQKEDVLRGLDEVKQVVKSGDAEKKVEEYLRGTGLESILKDKKKVETTKDVFSAIFGDDESGQGGSDVKSGISSLFDVIGNSNSGAQRYGQRNRPQFGRTTSTTTPTPTTSTAISTSSSSSVEPDLPPAAVVS